jgi:hypothetical protein
MKVYPPLQKANSPQRGWNVLQKRWLSAEDVEVIRCLIAEHPNGVAADSRSR